MESTRDPLPAELVFPSDKQASRGGHGTLEVLKVTQVLEENGISLLPSRDVTFAMVPIEVEA